MDYFYGSSPHKNAGLSDLYINLNFSTSANGTWQMAFHHFQAAAKVDDYSGANANTTLGNEADLTFNYQLMEAVKFMCGYSQMFTGASMKYVKNIPSTQNSKKTQNWVWLSFNFNPEILLFKSK